MQNILVKDKDRKPILSENRWSAIYDNLFLTGSGLGSEKRLKILLLLLLYYKI